MDEPIAGIAKWKRRWLVAILFLVLAIATVPEVGRIRAPNFVMAFIQSSSKVLVINQSMLESMIVVDANVNESSSAFLVNQLFDPAKSIRPLWTCGEAASLKKLIFVHVFKTAGSSLRTFFKVYGGQCQKGFALLIGCSEVKPPRNSSSVWKPCKASWIYTRNNTSLYRSKQQRIERTWTYDDMMTYETDILMGHLPLGVDRGWLEKDEQQQLVQVQAQYVSFFRDPAFKFVSAKLFVARTEFQKRWTKRQAVDQIKLHVYRDLAQGIYYDGHSRYLLTPEQKYRNPNMTLPEKVELVRRNLVDFPVLIGIVERMQDSLALLKFTIDPEGATEEAMDSLDVTNTNAKTLINNKSRLSSSELVAALKEDKVFWRVLMEYLKFEYPVYDFALQLHERQVGWVWQQQVGPTSQDSFEMTANRTTEIEPLK